MKDLKYYQKIIQDKRKQTDFRDFSQEIPAWIPFSYYKNNSYISRYPDTSRSPQIVASKDFIHNRDDLGKYALDYDETIGFFENFRKLFISVPMSPMISQMAGEYTEFSDTVVASKNAYLSNIVVEDCENIFYSFQALTGSRNIFNTSVAFERSENIYFSKGVIRSYKIFYSKYIENCANIWFSSNLIGCQECILCDDMENKKYCIANKQYEESEYFLEKSKILASKDTFLSTYKQVNNIGKITNSINCTGQFIKNSQNIESGFSVIDTTRDSRNILFTGHGENYYDCFDVGLDSNDMYGVEGGGTYSNNIYCSSQIETCSQVL